MAKQSKPNQPEAKQSAKVEIVYVVEKLKQIEYRLMKLTIEGDSVTNREEIARDIPLIIQGKYMMMLNNQGFTE